MKQTTIIILLIFLFACNKGFWPTQNVYRPKNPKFSILKKPFKENPLIDNRFLYLSKRAYISNSQKRIMYDFTGFYPDGRVIGVSLNDLELDKLNQRNSWKTAPIIGYYTTQENTITVEFFLPYDGGLYETRQGIIKEDTLFLLQLKNFPFLYKNKSYDTLAISSFPLK